MPVDMKSKDMSPAGWIILTLIQSAQSLYLYKSIQYVHGLKPLHASKKKVHPHFYSTVVYSALPPGELFTKKVILGNKNKFAAENYADFLPQMLNPRKNRGPNNLFVTFLQIYSQNIGSAGDDAVIKNVICRVKSELIRLSVPDFTCL